MSAADLTMLARFAEEQNTEQRFQALVQAGLAQPDTPANEWAAVVREYRDQWPMRYSCQTYCYAATW